MKKEVKPILLPTGNPAKPTIIKSDENGGLGYIDHWKLTDVLKSGTPQHLYIVDEKASVLIGSYHIFQGQVIKVVTRENSKIGFWLNDSTFILLDKGIIVATTDPRLIANGILPISEQFLKDFVAANGKGMVMMDIDERPKISDYRNKGFVKDNPQYNSAQLDSSGNAILSIVPNVKVTTIGYVLKIGSEDTVIRKNSEKKDPIEEAVLTFNDDGEMVKLSPIEYMSKCCNNYGKQFIGNELYLRGLAIDSYKAGWKANPAKWTDEDMRKAWDAMGEYHAVPNSPDFDEWLEQHKQSK